MSRLNQNLTILGRLENYLKENPTIRFGQALSNLNLATHKQKINVDGLGERDYIYEDIFYEEPEETLIKMRNV